MIARARSPAGRKLPPSRAKVVTRACDEALGLLSPLNGTMTQDERTAAAATVLLRALYRAPTNVKRTDGRVEYAPAVLQDAALHVLGTSGAPEQLVTLFSAILGRLRLNRPDRKRDRVLKVIARRPNGLGGISARWLARHAKIDWRTAKKYLADAQFRAEANALCSSTAPARAADDAAAARRRVLKEKRRTKFRAEIKSAAYDMGGKHEAESVSSNSAGSERVLG